MRSFLFRIDTPHTSHIPQRLWSAPSAGVWAWDRSVAESPDGCPMGGGMPLDGLQGCAWARSALWGSGVGHTGLRILLLTPVRVLHLPGAETSSLRIDGATLTSMAFSPASSNVLTSTVGWETVDGLSSHTFEVALWNVVAGMCGYGCQGRLW